MEKLLFQAINIILKLYYKITDAPERIYFSEDTTGVYYIFGIYHCYINRNDIINSLSNTHKILRFKNKIESTPKDLNYRGKQLCNESNNNSLQYSKFKESPKNLAYMVYGINSAFYGRMFSKMKDSKKSTPEQINKRLEQTVHRHLNQLFYKDYISYDSVLYQRIIANLKIIHDSKQLLKLHKKKTKV